MLDEDEKLVTGRVCTKGLEEMEVVVGIEGFIEEEGGDDEEEFIGIGGAEVGEEKEGAEIGEVAEVVITVVTGITVGFEVVVIMIGLTFTVEFEFTFGFAFGF